MVSMLIVINTMLLTNIIANVIYNYLPSFLSMTLLRNSMMILNMWTAINVTVIT